MKHLTRPRWQRILVLAIMGVFLAASTADARAGRGGGFGSRGSRSWQAPPPTPTAPRQATPLQREATPADRPSVAPGAARPGVATANRGFFSTRGGFLGGLVGAGLFGMLLGYGLFGGLGGLASILGLILQVLLVVFLVRLAFRFFQSRTQPAYAGASGPYQRTAPPPPPRPAQAGTGAAGPARPKDEVGIGQSDLDQFERLLQEVQIAYANEDRAGLARLATPEVSAELTAELDENARRGVVNHMADVKLLQGDLAEAWREDGKDYATVAMRFGLVDYVEDRATGRVVEGDPSRPTEATEVWTFVRPRGGAWRLSAIQTA